MVKNIDTNPEYISILKIFIIQRDMKHGPSLFQTMIKVKRNHVKISSHQYPVPPNIVINDTTMTQINLNNVRNLGLDCFSNEANLDFLNV